MSNIKSVINCLGWLGLIGFIFSANLLAFNVVFSIPLAILCFACLILPTLVIAILQYTDPEQESINDNMLIALCSIIIFSIYYFIELIIYEQFWTLQTCILILLVSINSLIWLAGASESSFFATNKSSIVPIVVAQIFFSLVFFFRIAYKHYHYFLDQLTTALPSDFAQQHALYIKYVSQTPFLSAILYAMVFFFLFIYNSSQKNENPDSCDTSDSNNISPSIILLGLVFFFGCLSIILGVSILHHKTHLENIWTLSVWAGWGYSALTFASMFMYFSCVSKKALQSSVILLLPIALNCTGLSFSTWKINGHQVCNHIALERALKKQLTNAKSTLEFMKKSPNMSELKAVIPSIISSKK